EHVVNLILTVDRMPDHISGYDLLMEVKKSPKLNHLPVVITSVDRIPERVKKCLDGGAKDYIQKPIDYTDVPRILRYI
ncbi:Two-component response regulator ORR12, partial [Dichanthelium oligosanthes]